VTSLPLVVKVILAAGLLVSITLAFFGRGPVRPASPRLVLAVALGGMIGYMVGLHAAVTGQHAFAAALIAVAVETMCLAVWLAKARSDGDGGTRRADEPDPADPGDDEGGPDWGEFDRSRALWGTRVPPIRPRAPREREPV
jgi:predicted permease